MMTRYMLFSISHLVFVDAENSVEKHTTNLHRSRAHTPSQNQRNMSAATVVSIKGAFFIDIKRAHTHTYIHRLNSDISFNNFLLTHSYSFYTFKLASSAYIRCRTISLICCLCVLRRNFSSRAFHFPKDFFSPIVYICFSTGIKWNTNL